MRVGGADLVSFVSMNGEPPSASFGKSNYPPSMLLRTFYISALASYEHGFAVTSSCPENRKQVRNHRNLHRNSHRAISTSCLILPTLRMNRCFQRIASFQWSARASA
eukprot:750475-Hanusia_phi.AAC.2